VSVWQEDGTFYDDLRDTGPLQYQLKGTTTELIHTLVTAASAIHCVFCLIMSFDVVFESALLTPYSMEYPGPVKLTNALSQQWRICCYGSGYYGTVHVLV